MHPLPEPPAVLMPRRYGLLAAAILLLATGLRFWHLGDWSMWVDEGMTYLRAVSGNLGDQGPLYATAPLNFLVTRAVVGVAEPSLFWLRFFPAVCGVGGVAAMLWAGYRLGGAGVSLIAGLLVALSPWHIDWSQNARHFSVLFLFMVVAFTAFHAFWTTGRERWLLLAAACAVLALLTHSSATFSLAAMVAYTAVLVAVPSLRAGVVTRRRLVAAAAFFLVLAGGYLPVALAVSRYLGAHKVAWNPPGNVAASILFYIGPFELAVSGLWALVEARRADRTGLLLLNWLVWPIVLVVLASARTIASGAYALPSLGAVALLVGRCFATLWSAPAPAGGTRAVAGIALAGLVAQLGVRTGLYFTAEQGNRPPWREAVAWVTERAHPGDDIFASEGVVAGFYLGDVARGRWLDRWHPPAVGERQWLLVLAGDESIATPPLGPYLGAHCTLFQVFYRNTGPKRRDIEVYRCAGAVA